MTYGKTHQAFTPDVLEFIARQSDLNTPLSQDAIAESNKTVLDMAGQAASTDALAMLLI